MTHRRRGLALLGLVFCLGLTLSACGDDSGDDASDDTAGSGGTDTTEPTEAACDGDVCLSGIAFAPDAVTVAVGDTVTWASVDSPDHTVTADDGSFDSGTLSNGETFEQTFDAAGEYSYHCEIHTRMTGTITVE